MADTDIPDVVDTDLTREEMEEVAGEYGIDPEGLEDQELLERLGVALGEIDEEQISRRDEDRQARAAGLRHGLAAKLEGAADRLRPSSEETESPAEQADAPDTEETTSASGEEGRSGPSETGEAQEDEDGADGDATEQSLPGETIEGRTRNQLRDELRELGLPVTGTKAQLEQRLDEARRQGDRAGGDDDEHDDQDGSDGTRMERLRQKVSRRLNDGSGTAGDEDEADDEGAGADDEDEEERLRDRLADRLGSVADRLHESGHDDSDSGAPSKLKRAGAAVKRRLPPW